MWFVRLFVLLVVATVLGCSGEDTTSVEVAAPNTQIQSALESAAETGQIDSGIMLVREQLELMQETDAAKADALLKDLDELESMTSTGKVKAKAKEMLSKL